MRYLKFFLFSLAVLVMVVAEATHIRAGEIIARRVSGNIYSFTFIGYRDVEGVQFGNGTFDFGDGQVFGGVNGQTIPWAEPVNIGNGVERWQFTLVHEYSGGSNYLVSYTEDFRNENIQNISGSVSTPFHVETLIVLDALILNSTPFFTVPPIDQGVVGAIFEHNPGAFDPDGDSLSYYFTTPKQASGQDVSGYRSLIDPNFYDNFSQGNSTRDGEPTLEIDPVTGTLTWDAPGGATIPDMENREFNVAFVVEEWRRINGELIRLGYVTRDMQIIIWNYDNEPPEIEVPEDTCVVAGDFITAIATGTDPDGDPVKMEAFGGPFEVTPSATFSPNPGEFQGPPSNITFSWDTECGVVRAQPYEVQFKATDRPTIPGIQNPPGQVNFETWRITVVGPAPEGLTVSRESGRSMQLDWDAYSCTNADSIQVWRRVGEFEIDPTCNPGIPENSGYELIETLAAETTSFRDNNGGLGLSPGSKYCYRLVATFPPPLGGLSIASEEACDSLIIDVPVITKVDVTGTSETDGTIDIAWEPPLQRDMVDAPYQYEVLRKEGLSIGGTFSSVSGPSSDLSFSDTGLNTEDNAYSYKIVLYDNTNEAVDTSEQASSVRLLPVPQVGGINLKWEANVPWSNTIQRFPYHYIYRDNVLASDPDALQLIDSVDVTLDGLTYLDDGRFNDDPLDEEIEYCYFITTYGSYDNDLLPEPLINNSQIVCAQPNDTIPPCPPVSVIFNDNFDCESQVSCGENAQLRNVLNWDFDTTPGCDDDIVSFRVYVSQSGEEDSFTLLAQTTSNEFFHEGLRSLAFCYYVTAVDRSGNESQISEIICNENCARYILPNIFTPGRKDGVNDNFRPLEDLNNCPRFVESVLFKVFNRAGTEVFTHDSTEPEKSILINWNGNSNAGIELPAGVYYYSAEVKFIQLNPENSTEVIKGWVQLIR